MLEKKGYRVFLDYSFNGIPSYELCDNINEANKIITDVPHSEMNFGETLWASFDYFEKTRVRKYIKFNLFRRLFRLINRYIDIFKVKKYGE